MAEEQNQTTATDESSQAGQAQFHLQKIYVKDVSFELPSAPEIFKEEGAAEIKLNLAQRVNNVTETDYEVVLTVTVTATTEEKTAYLAEVHQAGLFAISGVPEQQLQVVLNTLCPQTLFPYACRTITGLVADGGFPPLVLQPINFDQIFQQRMREAQARAEGTANDGAGGETQGNA